MPRFAYEAAGRDGAVARGVVDAATQTAAVERLVAEGRTPLRVVEQGRGVGTKSPTPAAISNPSPIGRRIIGPARTIAAT